MTCYCGAPMHLCGGKVTPSERGFAVKCDKCGSSWTSVFPILPGEYEKKCNTDICSRTGKRATDCLIDGGGVRES